MLAHGSILEQARFRPMAGKRDPLGPSAAHAVRVRQLREVLGYGETAAFARFLEVDRPRLANVEGGHPLSTDLARRIKQRTGATLDWLYDGELRGMPHELVVRLQAAGGRTKGRTATS